MADPVLFSLSAPTRSGWTWAGWSPFVLGGGVTFSSSSVVDLESSITVTVVRVLARGWKDG